MAKFQFNNDFFRDNNVTAGSVFRFLAMPEFKRSFVGFRQTRGMFKSVIAGLMRDSGILPYNHPSRYYGDLVNYSYKDLFGEAWFNMRRHGRGNIHQYGMFFSLLMLIACGIMMLVTLVSNIIVGAAIQTAQAGAGGMPDTGSLFSAPNPESDVGLWLIKTLIGDASMGQGSPMAQALGDMLAVYSYAVLVIAAFIVAWAILNIVVDTAHTGQFFGRRHNPVWYPIRLIFALALLIPLNHGFNAGQYAVIQVAEWGSGLGSRAWSVYVERMFGGDDASNLFADYEAMTQAPIVIDIGRNLVCMHALNQALAAAGHTQSAMGDNIVRMTQSSRSGGGSHNDMTLYKFGIQTAISPGAFRFEHDSQVCGTVQVALLSGGGSRTRVGRSSHLQNGYEQIRAAFEFNGLLDTAIEAIRQSNATQIASILEGFDPIAETFAETWAPENGETYGSDHDIYAELAGLIEAFDGSRREAIQAQISTLNSASKDTIVQAVNQAGWVSAGMWMHHIVSMNHRLNSALNEGVIVTPPAIRESFRTGCERRNWWRVAAGAWPNCAQEADIDDPNSTTGQHLARTLDILAGYDERVNAAMRDAGVNMQRDTPAPGSAEGTRHHGNPVERVFRYLFSPSIGGSTNLHPMAEMAQVGSKLVDKSLIMMALAMVIQSSSAIAGIIVGLIGTSIGGPIAGLFAGMAGNSLAQGLAKIMSFLAPLGLVAGLVLLFLLPMFPFIRFIMGVLNWLIAIVEAVLMMPIFALGHLRTDGEGLVGQMTNLYYFFMQLLLRPILLVFGLILGFTLYETIVPVVNEFYRGATMAANYSSFLSNMISGVAYAVIYVFLLYLLINACFKVMEMLVNAVPKWLGGSGDRDSDETNEGRFIGVMAAAAILPRTGGGQGQQGGGNSQDKKKPGGNPALAAAGNAVKK